MNRNSIVLAAIVALPISTAALASESLSYAYDPLGRLIGVVAAEGYGFTAFGNDAASYNHFRLHCSGSCTGHNDGSSSNPYAGSSYIRP